VTDYCASIREVFWYDKDCFKNTIYGKMDKELDLCEKCAADFELFMDGNPLKIEENGFDRPDIAP
jgi:hypothetical protein